MSRSSTDHIARSLHASSAMLAYDRYPGNGRFDLIVAVEDQRRCAQLQAG